MCSRGGFGRRTWRVFLAVALSVGSSAALADVDLSGPWRIHAETEPYLNPDVSCIVDVVQLGTSLGITGNDCSILINLSGTIDPSSGAFTASGGSDPFLCPTLSITGSAAPAGDGFGGTFNCNGVIPVTGPFSAGLCANGVVDSGEDCDDANLNIADCCSPTCEFDPPSYVCLADGTDCTTDHCDGAGTCVPVPGPAGERCESDFNGCTADVCDAAGKCTHPNLSAGTECIIDFDVCTDDRCDGNGACVTSPNTAPCDDFNTCTIGDRCAGGICVPGTGFAPAGIRCNTDSNFCTVDECDGVGGCSNVGCSLCCGGAGCSAQISPACATPGGDSAKARVRMKRREGDAAKDKLTFKWRGPATLADFGTPTASTSYELCLYQVAGFPQTSLQFQARAAAGGSCGGKPCWKSSGSAFSFRDPELDPDGVQLLKLKANDAGEGKITLKGKGANIGWYRLDLFDPPMTLQVKSSSGKCWGATFDTFDKVSKQTLNASGGH